MYNIQDADKTTLDLIAPGTYPAVITQWDVSAKDHVGYKAGFQITSGSYKGRYVSDYFILTHHNEMAQKIGFGKIADIAHACGIQTWETEHELTDRLVGKEIMLEVVKATDKRDGSEQNRVKTAYSMDGKNRSGHKMKLSALQPGHRANPTPSSIKAGDDSDVPF